MKVLKFNHKIGSVLLLFKEMGDIAWLNLLIVSLQAIHEENQQVKLWILENISSWRKEKK